VLFAFTTDCLLKGILVLVSTTFFTHEVFSRQKRRLWTREIIIEDDRLDFGMSSLKELRLLVEAGVDFPTKPLFSAVLQVRRPNLPREWEDLIDCRVRGSTTNEVDNITKCKLLRLTELGEECVFLSVVQSEKE
jgi:hypothetical protein